MASITEGQTQQYADHSKLAARARLHQEFTIGEVPWFPWVMSRLPLKSGDHVLDLGCGPGWLWTNSAQNVPEAIHLLMADQSEGMIKEAISHCANLPFASIRGEAVDAVNLPFAERTFDVVLAMHMLYHVPDQVKAIAEMHQVLKPGGMLAVTTNGSTNLAELYKLATILGSDPVDPSAMAFGYERATELLQQQFGNVSQMIYPASLQVTDPTVAYFALTSYPPGDCADEETLAALRHAIDAAFARHSGLLHVHNDTALFISTKQ